MFKSFLIAGGAALAALASGAAVAANAPAEQDNFYASKAIATGQYAEAEKVLQPASYVDSKDPARLINLATVYVQTNRFEAARETLEQVRALPDEALVLAGGLSFSSHSIATAMLNRIK